jgi:hypothetical protein
VLHSGRPDADEEDEVVGGVVGSRLKVTCRGARTGATPVRRLGGLRIRWCPGRFQAECGHLVGSIPQEEVC